MSFQGCLSQPFLLYGMDSVVSVLYALCFICLKVLHACLWAHKGHSTPDVVRHCCTLILSYYEYYNVKVHGMEKSRMLQLYQMHVVVNADLTFQVNNPLVECYGLG